VSRTTSRIQNSVTRLAFIGGSAIFAFALLEEFITPFIPLIITVLGSLIAGSLVRAIFIRMLNKRLFSEYRYTDTNANTNKQSTRSRTNNTYDETTSNESINRENAFAPPDSLSLYRNLLGLGPRFTGEELKVAYRRCAAMYHPDRYASASPNERQNAEDLMKKVNEAYERLKSAAL
jgi:hypothetical protein